MALLLLVFLHVFRLGAIAAAGVVVCMALLAYEHSLVSPKDLRRLDAAFFTLNGVISVLFFVSVATDILFHR